MKNKYYKAYEDRYKTIHEKGYSWSSFVPTPIVMETIHKYFKTNKAINILEIGCGEGRDSFPILKQDYKLTASDVSNEAIRYCKNLYKEYSSNFIVLDCLSNKLDHKYDFIFSMATIHMLVVDEDRNKFYKFIKDHLTDDGLALITSMGDGIMEHASDISKAFDLVDRKHESGDVKVTNTSCRIVNFETFINEINNNGLLIVDKGITSSLPDFNSLMYAVVKSSK